MSLVERFGHGSGLLVWREVARRGEREADWPAEPRAGEHCQPARSAVVDVAGRLDGAVVAVFALDDDLKPIRSDLTRAVCGQQLLERQRVLDSAAAEQLAELAQRRVRILAQALDEGLIRCRLSVAVEAGEDAHDV